MFIRVLIRILLYVDSSCQLIFFSSGDVTKGELGFAAIPGKEKDFEKSIKLTIDYAKALGCKM